MNEIIEIGTAVFVLTIARIVIYAVERITICNTAMSGAKEKP